MPWSVELANAFKDLHDLLADKLDATTDEEHQDLDNKIETQKAQVRENEHMQQQIMKDLQPDRPDGGLNPSLASLWSHLLLIATLRLKNPSVEENEAAKSELDRLQHTFLCLERGGPFPWEEEDSNNAGEVC
jgi:hypothetical protein